MNILITGVNGQLGSEIKGLSHNYGYNFFFENSQTLDITHFENVQNYINKNKINVVVNCAGYTAVDKAEEEPKKAEKVNVKGVENLIKSLKKVNGKLIHISTDYVFDGKKTTPYKEDDKVNPLGVYGKTKRAGEEVILNSEIEGIIIRTSWLYSVYGNNFVKTMLCLAKERKSINVVVDQVGTPTYAKDLAKVCLDIISSDREWDKKSKIYHYSNEGETTWYEFAKAIMEFAKVDCKVNPITTEDYPTLVKRPKYSVLDKSKIKKDFDIEIPYWQDSLNDFFIMRKNEIFKKLVKFLEDKFGVYEKISWETRMDADLGITGDEGGLFLQEFLNYFKIEYDENREWQLHFEAEGLDFFGISILINKLLGRKDNRKQYDLTVEHLVKIIELGYWIDME
ncbi:MAG: dTDP-4-dehydrorhamnose reductase [Flavobacteriaceae bacterium]|nr:dTDP-4-dehydrorhamnose reductase [Flavobacteriaceae bacterium]